MITSRVITVAAISILTNIHAIGQIKIRSIVELTHLWSFFRARIRLKIEKQGFIEDHHWITLWITCINYMIIVSGRCWSSLRYIDDHAFSCRLIIVSRGQWSVFRKTVDHSSMSYVLKPAYNQHLTDKFSPGSLDHYINKITLNIKISI